MVVLEGVCSFLTAETWLRKRPRPILMDIELHAAGGYVCLPHNRCSPHVVPNREAASWLRRRRRSSGISRLKALHADQACSGV